MAHPFIAVRFASEEKGRGAFATRDIRAGTVIDEAHVVLVPKRQYPAIQQTILDEYTFEIDWNDGVHSHAVPMSPASFMNHGSDPNVSCSFERERLVLVFTTTRAVPKGEELLIDYTGDEHGTPAWFTVA